MPEPVRKGIGFALWRAQEGKRAIYTVRFAEAVYVLHVFQKKSPSGAKVPRATVALIAQRLRAAEAFHKASLRETR